jgi:hypothetical protein
MGFHQIAAQLRLPAGVVAIGLPPGIPQPGPHLAEEEGDRHEVGDRTNNSGRGSGACGARRERAIAADPSQSR